MTSSKLPSWLKHADFILIDLASLALAFVLSYWIKFGNLELFTIGSWRGLFAMVLIIDVAITLLTGPYSGIFRRSYWRDVGSSLKLALWNFLVVSVLFYLLKIGEEYSREMLVITYGSYALLAMALKAIHKKRMLSRRENRPSDSVRRVVMVTNSSTAGDDEALSHADDMRTIEVVGFCLADTQVVGECLGRPAAPSDGIVALCSEQHADEVLILVNPSFIGDEALESLIDDGVRVRFAITESLGVGSETQSLGNAGVLKTLDLERYSFGSDQLLYLALKRLFDIVLGLFGCIVVLPVAAVVKISYLISGDAHSIFYHQTRIGLGGKPFELYKIRTMVWNADEILKELLKDPKMREEWERDQKFSNDPRITPVGRFLRRTSLDELPQFLNVLMGQMSVVGPRPLVPGELESHGGRPLYVKVKPGITGWWGCNGRSNIDYRERLELEYYYVRHCSLYLDVLCIFRTAVAVIKKDGAQ